jgi:hypothetical protein
MSRGDLYRKNKLSLAGQLRLNRFAPIRLSKYRLSSAWVYDPAET